MPQLNNKIYTADDYWNLPQDQRAELINGQLYAMAPPSYTHQKLVSELNQIIGSYIKRNNGNCEVIPAPFAVNLTANDETYVEPDLSIICDKSKITEHGCNGAPDFIIEIVSPSSRKMDYNIKNGKYAEAGVREYWIVDPAKERTTIYCYEKDAAPAIFPFNQAVSVGIYDDLSIVISDLIH